jgi:hypothetical protein
MVSQAHLELLLQKAGFRPDEPRIPAGNPDGGQWTDEGGSGSSSHTTSSGRHVRILQVSDDEVPKIPDHPPLRPRDRYAIARFVLRRSPLGRAALTAWRIYELASDAFAYFDEPKTLEELEQAAKEPKTGYDIHHIVEQRPAGVMVIRKAGSTRRKTRCAFPGSSIGRSTDGIAREMMNSEACHQEHICVEKRGKKGMKWDCEPYGQQEF